MFPVLVEIGIVSLKSNAANAEYSQDIMKKQFQRQLTAPPHKQTLLCDTYLGEKKSYSFNTVHIKICVVLLCFKEETYY